MSEPKVVQESDQSKFNLGVRDLEGFDSEAGKFLEFEVYPYARRDPEESRYNEAGQPVYTQGDAERRELKEEVKREDRYADK